MRLSDVPLASISRKDYKAFYNSVAPSCSNRGLVPSNPRVTFVLDRLHPTDEVLEFGCQDGGQTRLMAPRCKSLLAMDVSGYYVNKTKELGLPNVTVVEGFCEDAAGTEAFDVVVATEVIEHVLDPVVLLKVVRRILRREGRLLLTTPIKGKHTDRRGEHLRYYVEDTLLGDLTTAGFRVTCFAESGIYYLVEATQC